MMDTHPGTNVPRTTGGATVPVFDRYSQAERDRRWDAVRRGAAAAGFDCVMVPLGDGPDGRYLTQLKVAVVVLPTDGSAPVVLTDRNARSSWVPEPWHIGRAWAQLMGDAIEQTGMSRARIGVVGLHRGTLSHLSSPDGVVVYTAFADVVARFPEARFEDATDVLGAVRASKSQEEIDCLRRAVEMAELGVQALVDVAGEGQDGAVVYGRVVGSMLQKGSAYMPMRLGVRRAVDRAPTWYEVPPIGLRLQRGDVLDANVRAIYGYLVAEEQQQVVIGTVPEDWKPAIELQRDLFERGLELLQPGASARDLVEQTRRLAAGKGLSGAARLTASGLGDDGPRVDERTEASDADWEIRAGTTWVWAPTVTTADGAFTFAWGGNVVVSPSGAEKLFRREHGLRTA